VKGEGETGVTVTVTYVGDASVGAVAVFGQLQEVV